MKKLTFALGYFLNIWNQIRTPGTSVVASTSLKTNKNIVDKRKKYVLQDFLYDV